MKKHDIVIIGGGIVGLATAMALAKNPKLNLALIEAEPKVAAHQTGNNSGVIHSGLYYKPGSLKAKNCVFGRRELYRFCRQQQIPNERCGKLVVATRQQEFAALDELERRGRANGLRGLRRLNGAELIEYEPHVKGLRGLYVPQTGIVDYGDVAQAYARIFKEAENDLLLQHRFLSLIPKANELIIQTSGGVLSAKYLINCAGLQSDRVALRCGVKPGVRIVPFRGEYYKLRSRKSHLVKNLIYPVPDPAFPFLGVHFTRMIKGGVEAGPNAVLAFKREGYHKTSFSLKDTLDTFRYPGFWKLAGKYLSMGLQEFYRSYYKKAFVKALQRLIPEIEEADIISGGAGVRAQALDRQGKLVDDFRIIQAERMIHILNAPSPAATASISIGKTISEMALKSFSFS